MYQLDDLLYLMSRLRDPKNGCPWDLKQTFASILPHTLEEAYEVADAIEKQDYAHLKEELGDLLFQVIFYSQLGKEENHFDFPQIIDTLVTKLVRRHPHVFPSGELHSTNNDTPLNDEQIKGRWEAIKQQERDEKAKLQGSQSLENTSVLADIPLALPAIQRAEKLQKRAATVGFDWPEPVQVLDKIEEEKELKNIESKLNALAFDKKELENKFNNPDLTQEKINELSDDLQKIIDTIEAKEERWFELSSKLEE